MRSIQTLTVRLMIACALVSLGAFAPSWLQKPVTPDAKPATPAPQVQGLPTVAVPVQKIQALAPKAKTRLNLPAAVQADPGQHVVSASRVKADPYADHTVSVVVDEQTGGFQAFESTEPMPWLAMSSMGAAGVLVGQRSDGAQVARFMVRQDVMRSKRLFAGVAAHLDSDGKWLAGVSMEWRW